MQFFHIVDHLTKLAQSLPVKTNYLFAQYVLNKMHTAMGTILIFSTAYITL